MTTKILVMCVSAFLIFGCKGKEKKSEEVPAESAPTQTVEDTSIQNKELSFDAQGSDSGNIAGLSTLHFEYNKSTLTSESRDLAQKNVNWMKEHPTTVLQIEGHCDRHGSIEYNLALGERRAKSVKAYMTNLGVEERRLSIISYGKEKPVDPNENEMADGKNRRANFVVQGK